MTGKTKKIKSVEPPLLSSIRELVVSARRTVARGVDNVQVLTNFEIGRLIVEHEQQGEKRAGYGQEVLRALSERLAAEFGSGFSKRNLEYMRRFYLEHKDRRTGIAQTLSAQSSDKGKNQLSLEPSPFSKPRPSRTNQKTQTVFGQLDSAARMPLYREISPFG